MTDDDRKALGIMAGVGTFFAGLLYGGKVVYDNKVKDQSEFVKRLWAAMLKVPEAAKLSVASRLIIIAHGAYETGYGKGTAAKAHNYWNITRGLNDSRPWIPGKDTEGGKVITQRWRAYKNDEEAVRDYLAFIGPGTRYAEARKRLEAGDAAGFIAALKKAGYFTAPLPPYQTAITKMVATTIPKMVGPVLT